MRTYQYTSPENNVVAVIDEDGISRMSMLAHLVPKGEQIIAYEPPPPVAPTSVTMRQARRALLDAGLLNDVEVAINWLPSPQKEAARIDWEYSQEVQRHNGFVSLLAPSLGLTEAQLDQMFIQAATL